MKKEIAEMWVKVLRSGEYRQGYGNLKTCDANGVYRHCCLGVLCEMAKADGVMLDEDEFVVGLDDVDAHIHAFMECTQGIPEDVMNWAGMKTDFGLAVGMVPNVALSFMNDSERHFEDIADFIDRNWEKL